MMLSLYTNKDDNEKRVLQNTQPKPERDRDRGEQLSFVAVNIVVIFLFCFFSYVRMINIQCIACD